jgi:hypothetical protein
MAGALALISLFIGIGGGLLIGRLVPGDDEPASDPITTARMNSLAASLHATQDAWQTERDMMAATLGELQRQGGRHARR